MKAATISELKHCNTYASMVNYNAVTGYWYNPDVDC